MRVPTVSRALAGVGVVALLTARCLQAENEGGDPGEATGKVKGSTIEFWSNNDQPIIDGWKKVVDPKAKELGITIK